MTRKPVQITTVNTDMGTRLFALADDGTMWASYVSGFRHELEQWTELRPLPQGLEGLGE